MTDDQTPDLFDPSDHTVDEVKSHLDGADATEYDRVKAAEATGKSRKGILEYGVVEPGPGDPDRPQVGDTWEGEDGYTRVVVAV